MLYVVWMEYKRGRWWKTHAFCNLCSINIISIKQIIFIFLCSYMDCITSWYTCIIPNAFTNLCLRNIIVWAIIIQNNFPLFQPPTRCCFFSVFLLYKILDVFHMCFIWEFLMCGFVCMLDDWWRRVIFVFMMMMIVMRIY